MNIMIYADKRIKHESGVEAVRETSAPERSDVRRLCYDSKIHVGLTDILFPM